MIKTLFKKILIEPHESDSQIGNIIIPEAYRQIPETGVVVCVGDECKALKGGENVLFTKFTGVELSYEGKSYKLMEEGDVLAVFE